MHCKVHKHTQAIPCGSRFAELAKMECVCIDSVRVHMARTSMGTAYFKTYHRSCVLETRSGCVRNRRHCSCERNTMVGSTIKDISSPKPHQPPNNMELARRPFAHHAFSTRFPFLQTLFIFTLFPPLLLYTASRLPSCPLLHCRLLPLRLLLIEIIFHHLTNT